MGGSLETAGSRSRDHRLAPLNSLIAGYWRPLAPSDDGDSPGRCKRVIAQTQGSLRAAKAITIQVYKKTRRLRARVAEPAIWKRAAMEIGSLLKSVTKLLSAKYMIAVFLCAGFSLFAPCRILDGVGVADFRDEYRTFIGIAFLSTAALLVVYSAIALGRVFRSIRNTAARRRMEERYLCTLAEAEKRLLRIYVWQGQATQNLPIQDGVTGGVQAKGIIYRASSLSNADYPPTFAYNIQPWAEEYLKGHPELLASPKET